MKVEETTKELLGGCDCGAVHYKITGSVKLVVNCHCNACRKRNGASYSTYCVVSQDDLNIVQGMKNIATYEVSENGKKQFCSKCGSPLYTINKRYPGLYMVHYGTLLDHSGLAPAFNIYCESKLPWVNAISYLKSFEKAIER
jgi:hypothetical protein